MEELLLDLDRGDWIVHSRYGLGQVVAVEEKSLAGKDQLYFNVKTETFNYWLSKDNLNSGRVRHLGESVEFYEALNLISSEPELLDENFHNRLQSIKDLISENSILSKAQLIRDMNGRNVRKDIHSNERNILETQKDQFINEFALACQVSENDARDQVRSALEKSSVNLKHKKPLF